MSKTDFALSSRPNAEMLCDCVFFLYQHDLPDRPCYSLAAWDLPRRSFLLAEDITDRSETAERFLRLLQQERVSPCHIIDVLEDLLPLH